MSVVEIIAEVGSIETGYARRSSCTWLMFAERERAEATAPSVVVEDLPPRECLGWRGAKPAAGRDSLQRRQ